MGSKKKAQLQRSTEAFEEAGFGSPKSSSKCCLRRFFFGGTPGKKEIPEPGGGEEIMLFRVFFLCCLGCQSVIFSFRPFLEGTAKGIEAGADYDSINQHMMCFFKKLMCSTFLYQNTSGNVKNYRIDFNIGVVFFVFGSCSAPSPGAGEGARKAQRT